MVLTTIKAELVDDSTLKLATDLKVLPDQILSELHAEMREILELRHRRYPHKRALLDIDMKKQLLVEKGDNNVIYSFGWKDDKFMRCYHPDHYEYSKPFNNVTDSSPLVTDLDNVKLYNRYKPRPVKAEQMQCMLYASISAVQWIEYFQMVEFRMVFRSPCMPTTLTKVFLVSYTTVIPVIAEIIIGKRKFSFEFDDRVSYLGSGQTRRALYSMYKLINYYVAVPNYMQKVYLPDVKVALEQYEKAQTRSPKSDTTDIGASRTLSVKTNNDPNLASDKLEFKGKKGMIIFRKLYKKYDLAWLAYKNPGETEILANEDNRKPYYDYNIIKSIWESSNPIMCTIQAQTFNMLIRWETRYVNVYGKIPGTNSFGNYNAPTNYPVYEGRHYHRLVCTVI